MSIKEKFHYDDGADRLIVERSQDVSAILERNKAWVNSQQAKKPSAGRYNQTYNFVASIPMIVIEKWMQEGIDFWNPSPEDKRKIRQYLNGDYKHLKTTPGTI